MLDLKRLNSLRIQARPRSHDYVGKLLEFAYEGLNRVETVVEGWSNLPTQTPVILAMNHTDRYNYWPWQVALWKRQKRYTCAWVKGKYYENRVVAGLLAWGQQIPVPSRGYIITKDAQVTLRHMPSSVEYEGMRRAVNDGDTSRVPKLLLQQPRSILGREFDPTLESYPDAIEAVFEEMSAQFLKLNREALDLGRLVLVFPQGTRSKRLSRGHIGIAEVALHLKTPIVPIGCSGSDIVYPSALPFPQRGRVIYRIGKPISVEELQALGPQKPFTPFSKTAETEHRDAFQKIADVVMERLNDLVDPEYRFSENLMSDGVQGIARFV